VLYRQQRAGENGELFWMLNIQDYSLLLDLRILWRTLGAVFRRKDAC
jgi:lipopolysaccharide/colanic/teichoic acid biosynthesis glycosyltransferase